MLNTSPQSSIIIASARRKYVLDLAVVVLLMFGSFICALIISGVLLTVSLVSQGTIHVAPTVFFYPILPILLFGVYLIVIFWKRLFRIKDLSALEQISLVRKLDVIAEFAGRWPTRLPLVKIPASALSKESASSEERIFTAQGKGFQRISGKGATPAAVFFGPDESLPVVVQTGSTLLQLTETSPAALDQIRRNKLSQWILSLLLLLILIGPLICRPLEIAWLASMPQMNQDIFNETPASTQNWTHQTEFAKHLGFKDNRAPFCALILSWQLFEEGDYHQSAEVALECARLRKEALNKNGGSRDLYLILAYLTASDMRSLEGDFDSAAKLMAAIRLAMQNQATTTMSQKILPGISVEIPQMIAPALATLHEARYMRAGSRFAEAETLYRRALAEVPPGNAFRTLGSTVWEELANLHFFQGKTEEAKADIRKAISNYPSEKCSDYRDHFHTSGHGWAQLAAACVMQSPTEADDCMTHAISIIEDEEGPISFHKAAAIAAHAEMYRQRGNIDAARQSVKSAMKTWRESQGTGYVSYALLLLAHAETLDKDGSEKAALNDLDQAIKLSSDNANAIPEFGLASRHSAQILWREKHFEKAIERNQQAIESYRRKVGLYAWPLAATLVESAAFAEQMHDAPRAEQLYKELVEVCTRHRYASGYERDAIKALRACAKFSERKGDHTAASWLLELARDKERRLIESDFLQMPNIRN